MRNLFFSLVIVSAPLSLALGQCEYQKLTAFDGQAGDYFGTTVTHNENVLVSAALGVAPNGGAVYVYRRVADEWIFEQQLTQPGSGSFGRTLSLSNDVLVVGATGDSSTGNGPEAGAAYVYRYSAGIWSLEATIVESLGAPYHNFGASFVHDNILVVGSPRRDTANGFQAGAAFVYGYNGSNWVQQQYVEPGNLGTNDNFGWPAVVDGATMMVAAPSWDGPGIGSDRGRVYVYGYNGTNWFQEQQLIGSTVGSDDHFGTALALDGDVCVVGTDVGTSYGSAYVFRHNGTSWVEEQILQIVEPAMQSGDFARSVAVDGDTIVVGARHWDAVFQDQGAAYVYKYNGSTWDLEQQLLPPDPPPASSLEFGGSVSLRGQIVAIGARGDDDIAPTSGSVHSIGLVGVDSDNNGIQDCLESFFRRGDANGDGSVNVADTVRILAHLFQQSPVSCEVTLDTNDDNHVNIADSVYLLVFLFGSGSPPPDPFAQCGTDPTEGTLLCPGVSPCL